MSLPEREVMIEASVPAFFFTMISETTGPWTIFNFAFELVADAELFHGSRLTANRG